MTTTLTPSTHRATFAIGDEQTAKRVADLLTENFFGGEAAIAAFEGPAGRWDITLHFAQAPDEDAIRLWERIGMPSERIVPLPSSENFWHVGGPGLCGDECNRGAGEKNFFHVNPPFAVIHYIARPRSRRCGDAVTLQEITEG